MEIPPAPTSLWSSRTAITTIILFVLISFCALFVFTGTGLLASGNTQQRSTFGEQPTASPTPTAVSQSMMIEPVSRSKKSADTRAQPLICMDCDPNPSGGGSSNQPAIALTGDGTTISSTPEEVLIHFDDLPNNFNVGSYYPQATFSTDNFFYPVHTFQNCGPCSTSSPPNFISTKPNDAGELIVNFTRPVNNLSFWVVGIDTRSGNFGFLDVFENDLKVATYNFNGTFSNPAWVNLTTHTNVTKIRAYSLTDVQGVGFDDFRFTPVGRVESVTWQPLNGPLDNNPKAGGGLRIYPDRQSPSDTTDRRTIRVRAVTSLGANKTVYFKAFDIDDPSTDAAPVDPNGNMGNDNRGQPQAGTLSALSAQTDSNGVATVDLSVTMHPGDNFVVAGSAELSYLNSITVNGLGLQDSTGGVLPTARAKSTVMLTVWRQLHIEVDSMGIISGNQLTGSITSVAVNTCIGCGPKTSRDRTRHFVFVDKTLDLHRYGDSNTPYQGTLTVNGVRYSVIYNSTNSVFINTPDLIPPAVGAQFVLDDDDDFNQNDAILRSDEGEALTALADTFSLMQTSDDPLKNVYAAAYIMPVYDGGGALSNNQNNIPFTANVADGTASWDAQLNLGWNSESNERDDFWVVLLQLAYQGDVTEDTDPNSEPQTGGAGGVYGSVNDVTGAAGVPLGGDGNLVFIEAQVDGDRSGGFDLRKRSAPHEIGHQMGLKGDDLSVPEFGIMNAVGGLTFGPRHLNVLRWRVRSPGFQP